MTNLPFLLQTTNFLPQSICTNIPSHQSPGARPNFHYLCKTDYKMKQKLTTANLGPRRERGREGEGGWEQVESAPWEGTRGSWEKKSSPGKVTGWKSQGGGRAMERAPKNLLEMPRSPKGRCSELAGRSLRCKKSAQNCSVERGEARRNTEISQIEWEWPQQSPAGFRGVSIRDISSLQLNSQGGLRRKPTEAFGDGATLL